MIPEAEEAVIKALSLDTPAHERMDLVEELSRVNEQLTRDFVETVLVRVLKEDANSIVRHEAAFSLGSLHCPGKPLSGTSIEALCEAAESDLSGVVRHEAAEVLGWVREGRVREVLESMLCDPSEDIAETARISLSRHDSGAKTSDGAK